MLCATCNVAAAGEDVNRTGQAHIIGRVGPMARKSRDHLCLILPAQCEEYLRGIFQQHGLCIVAR